MKSHHIAVVPIVEELASHGHEVTFILPAGEEAKGWFPKGVKGANLIYIGDASLNIEKDLKSDAYDMKNLGPIAKVQAWASLMWNYRQMIDKPMFGMYDEFVKYIQENRNNFDVIFSSMASFAMNYALVTYRIGIPTVAYLSTQPSPVYVSDDPEHNNKYPNMMNPPSISSLKEYFGVRVKNLMVNQFLQAYTVFALHEMKAVMVARNIVMESPIESFAQLLFPFGKAQVTVALGGPPLLVPFKYDMPNLHVVGIVGNSEAKAFEPALLAWLDSAKDLGAPVIYVSMGTKYELKLDKCLTLVAGLEKMISSMGVRVLWSLRASQQEELQSALPVNSESLRIERFTPQQEVLAHPAVQVFLSHCGWGGVTDTLLAGVPTLAYPGFSEQFLNAAALVDSGAGLLLQPDLSNLIDDTKRLLEDSSFTSASTSAGKSLLALGGLKRVVEIVERTAAGEHTSVMQEQLDAMKKVDPFFLKPQDAEYQAALAIWISTAAVTLLVAFVSCRCCCRCCCRSCCGGCRGRGGEGDSAKKNR